MSAEILITTLIVAVTQLTKAIREKNWEAVVTILSAGIIGALVGVLHVAGIDPVAGLLYGLAAVGIVTVAQKAGGN